jgi:hypothetical protein
MEFVIDQEIEINGMSGTYTGGLVDGVPHGDGTMEYADAIYEGKWHDGDKHGLGTMKWFDGDGKVIQTRKGKWANDKPIKIHRFARNHTSKGGKTKRKRRGNTKNRRTKLIHASS